MTPRPARIRLLIISLLGSLCLTVTGCGYHTVGSSAHLPNGLDSIAVPVFKTETLSYHTEVAFTDAVVRELSSRTHYRVTSSDDAEGDGAVLRGTILTQTITPLIYNSGNGNSGNGPASGSGARQTTGAATVSYIVTITARATLTSSSGQVLYQNSHYQFRQQYETTQDLARFVQEDSPAVNRLARDFAQSLVADILESF